MTYNSKKQQQHRNEIVNVSVSAVAGTNNGKSTVKLLIKSYTYNTYLANFPAKQSKIVACIMPGDE